MPTDVEAPVLPYTSRLRELLVMRYNLEEFRLLCADLNFNHEELAPAGLSAQIQQFLMIFHKGNRLDALVIYCKAQFPADPWEPTAEELKQFQTTPAEVKPITVGLVMPQGEEGASVQRGLEALTELMQLPEARTAVIAFRTDFEAIIGQIELLTDYKQAHDLLHNLEQQCLGALRRAEKLFPDDETTIDELLTHDLTLQQIIAELKSLATRPTFVNDELTWIQDIERGRESLSQAVNTSDPNQLKRAILFINRVLAIQPSRINNRLNAVARTLRLSALVAAMTNIHQTLRNLNMDALKLEQFVQGAFSLAKLSSQLDALIRGHDGWQAVIVELRRIDSSMAADPLELELSWPDLKKMIEKLYENSTESWVNELKEDINQLDQAITGVNPALMKRFFRRLDSRAGNRFYRVDLDLRRLCEDLRRVGQPLATILQILS